MHWARKSLKLSIATPRYFLCHARVRPGVPRDRQEAGDLLWIRDQFLNSTHNARAYAG
jgi:serine/threonine protein phosphatase 1